MNIEKGADAELQRLFSSICSVTETLLSLCSGVRFNHLWPVLNLRSVSVPPVVH